MQSQIGFTRESTVPKGTVSDCTYRYGTPPNLMPRSAPHSIPPPAFFLQSLTIPDILQSLLYCTVVVSIQLNPYTNFAKYPPISMSPTAQKGHRANQPNPPQRTPLVRCDVATQSPARLPTSCFTCTELEPTQSDSPDRHIHSPQWMILGRVNHQSSSATIKCHLDFGSAARGSTSTVL